MSKTLDPGPILAGLSIAKKSINITKNRRTKTLTIHVENASKTYNFDLQT